MPAHRNWVFTLNGVTEEDLQDPYDWPVEYAVWQYELGENGNPHLQGYVHLDKPRSLQWCKTNLDDSAHWEPRRGTHAEAREYCTKDDTRVDGPWEFGDPPKQGDRSDLLALQTMLDTGASIEQVAREHFGAFMRYNRNIRAYRELTLPHRNPDNEVHVYVYWGPPGTGKSRRALYEAGEDAYFLSPPNAVGGAVWWDGYTGQDCIIIDDFYGWIPHHFMLRLCDRYPFTVQYKGGSIPIAATRIWITSNKEPNEWWPRTGLGAMERRITHVDNMTGEWHPDGRWTKRAQDDD